jgi:hypothetical protein
MHSEAELKAQKARSGMADDEHQRLVAAVESAAMRAGIKTKAAAKVVAGAALGDGMVKVEADGSIGWNGPEGWDLATGMPAYLRRQELAWIRQRDRELAGEVAPDPKDAKAALAARLAAALGAAGPAPTMTRETLGQALIETL